MPYVKQDHRKVLDPILNDVAEDLAKRSLALKSPQEIGHTYHTVFCEVANLLRELEMRQSSVTDTSILPPSIRLAKAIFDIGKDEGGFWAGDLNYALTRIIQLVPKKLVQQKKWDREFRYWIYAVTAGALERTALVINNGSMDKQLEENWINTALVGVLLDVKDEYKRRVNAPYEEAQIKANGDCYDVKM